ncbi:MAG: sigma-54 dependent transcriptional regulator [Thermodesulfobacteriota bacterium]
MPARPILVVDDEPHPRQVLFEALTRLGHAVDLAEDGLAALDKLRENNFDLIISDVRMPRLDGLELLRMVKKTWPHLPVVLVTGYGSIEGAVQAMREGAFDYFLKPFSMDLIEETVRRAFHGLDRRQNPGYETDPPGERAIITEDPVMKRLLNMSAGVAGSKATVLLQGESGTGKELFARFIHSCSDRAQGPFVAVNCASLPEGLLESELFGHEKGSFTGAVSRKIGKFELADQGTILLDEVSEMDLSLQAKLLRVLQEGEVDRVGGKAPTRIDVRVIATTNRHLKSWVIEGRFRQDLYYRLNVIPLTIPPLRSRRGDIPLLADYFLKKYSDQGRLEKKTLTQGALNRLLDHDWPGNVRELENIMARGVLLSSGSKVDSSDLFLEDLPGEAPLETIETQSVAASSNNGRPATLMTIREMEKGLIQQALIKTDGNRTHAARILGISVRTLRNKLAEYNGLGLETAGEAA